MLRHAARWPVAIILALTLTSPALAQELPEEVRIGEGRMTVGFELKTRTNDASGPNGNVASHSLLRFIIPTPGARWSAPNRAIVDRWGELSLQEKTRFFFENYRGEHAASNFQVDVERFPHLDKSVTWHFPEINVPHLEIRSNPFDNPRLAMAEMERLKSSVPETIAFHMHTRFPDAAMAERAPQVVDWLRRTSWAIWLRRAHVSSRTDFVLKSMDNQPMNVSELQKALRALSSERPRAMEDLVERRGIRVNRIRHPDGSLNLDIEFRGLMKDTGRLRRFLNLTAATFGPDGRAGPWAFDRDNPFFEHSSERVIPFRTFGWDGQGEWTTRELNWLASEIEGSRERFGLETNLTSAQLAEAVKLMATADTRNGKKMLLPSAFNWLFLPLEHDRALPEEVQEGIEQAKRNHIRKILRLAERINTGEFGTASPEGSERSAEGLRPGAVATRIRRILHDFVNVEHTSEGHRAKLFEWFERSLENPAEVEQRNTAFRERTGRNRLADWRRAREAAREATGMTDRLEGSARGGRSTGGGASTANEGTEAHHDRPGQALEAEVAGMTDRIREGARNLWPGVHWMSQSGHEQLEVRIVEDGRPKVTAQVRTAGSTVSVSRGMLEHLEQVTSRMQPANAERFRQRAIMLMALDAMNRATSMDLNIDRAAERSAVFAESPLTRAELDRMGRLAEATGTSVPEIAERMANGRTRTTRSTGLLTGEVGNESLRRVRERTMRGRRSRRGR